VSGFLNRNSTSIFWYFCSLEEILEVVRPRIENGMNLKRRAERHEFEEPFSGKCSLRVSVVPQRNGNTVHKINRR
jgi:hypothetical protein